MSKRTRAPAIAVIAAFAGASALALVALLIVPAGCGGGVEKKALTAYEVQVEPLIAEDEGVGVRLTELRKDLLAGNEEAQKFLPFAKETALPFYEKFAERLDAVEPGFEELRTLHEELRKYVEQRREYLAVGVQLFESVASPALRTMGEQQNAMREAMEALSAQAKGSLSDLEVAQALGHSLQFETRMAYFRQGQVSVDAVTADLKDTILPLLRRVEARTRNDLRNPGIAGAVARFATTAREYMESTLASLPLQERLRSGNISAEQFWNDSEAARKKFIEGLGKLRDRFR